MTEFDKRLNEYYDELKWLYFSLYGEDHAALDYFCDVLRRSYKERSAGLRKWDRKRTADPDWYKDNKRFGMLMYVDCFAENLKGVRKHLPYIKETGINYLHLMPILKSPEGRSDGGFGENRTSGDGQRRSAHAGAVCAAIPGTGQMTGIGVR